MEYTLTCDTCEYDETVKEDDRIYAFAKNHESKHPGHFVLIETVQ